MIHRGSSQIGGCCTQISTGRSRILIDFGANLPGEDQTTATTTACSRRSPARSPCTSALWLRIFCGFSSPI